ncbi:hypothetical protein NMY22_g10760 [Coprinellus aureogranulatus]|nr:hypothetical protein NMY22_g10760 [Coprinellus aureogranulatus]
MVEAAEVAEGVEYCQLHLRFSSARCSGEWESAYSASSGVVVCLSTAPQSQTQSSDSHVRRGSTSTSTPPVSAGLMGYDSRSGDSGDYGRKGSFGGSASGWPGQSDSGWSRSGSGGGRSPPRRERGDEVGRYADPHTYPRDRMDSLPDSRRAEPMRPMSQYRNLAEERERMRERERDLAMQRDRDRDPLPRSTNLPPLRGAPPTMPRAQRMAMGRGGARYVLNIAFMVLVIDCRQTFSSPLASGLPSSAALAPIASEFFPRCCNTALNPSPPPAQFKRQYFLVRLISIVIPSPAWLIDNSFQLLKAAICAPYRTQHMVAPPPAVLLPSIFHFSFGQPGQGESAQSAWLCIRHAAQPLVAVLGRGLLNTMMTVRSQKAYELMNISVQVASITILYYDYALTFLDEIEYIWSKPWKLTTLFYVFCRYSLIANPLYLVSISTTVLESVGALLSWPYLNPVWGLRTSSIYGKHKVVSVFLGVLGTSVIILLIIRAPFNQCHGPVKFQWCVVSRPRRDPHLLTNDAVRGALAATMLFYEVSAWLLAVVHAWRTVREDMKLWSNPKQSLNYVIFSQGLTYISLAHCCILALHAHNYPQFCESNAIPLHVATSQDTTMQQVNLIFTRMLNSIKLPLSGVLTARFLIELRKWESRRSHFDSRNSLPSYDPNVSTNIHFTNGSDPNVAPPKLPSPVGDSVIQELGRDIGPRPRAVAAFDGNFSDTEMVDVEEVTRNGEMRRHGKGRQLDNEDPLETPSVQGDRYAPQGSSQASPSPTSNIRSPVSALFSAGNISRRAKQRSSPIESSQQIPSSSSQRTLDTTWTQRRIQQYVKSTHHD